MQILGDGSIKLALNIKAAKFSSSAIEKIKAAGGEATEVPQKPKWTKALHKERVAAAAENPPKQKSKAPKARKEKFRK